jgi:endonuclease/exonuclease/phosphatase family metal-dependent hydrolase
MVGSSGASKVAAILGETAESAGVPHALVGDLNVEPQSPEMQPLLDRCEVPGR